MKKTTVCIVSDGYPYNGNFEFAFVKELVDELAHQGVEITVVSPQSLFGIWFRGNKRVPLTYRYDINGKEVTVYRPYSLSFGGRFAKLQYKLNSIVISRLVRKKHLQFDAYYGHFWHSGFQLYHIAKKQHVPLYVASGESHIFLADTYKASEIAPFLNYVTKVICVSSKNRDESIKLGLCSEEKCVVLPNGYNEKTFYPVDKEICRSKFGFPQDMFLVSFLGAFIERKGADRVSSAIKQLGDESIKGIFIGKAQEGNTPHEPAPETAIHTGYVPHDKLRDLLCCADAFVLPTYQEGCCNAIIEAIACGLPIISSDRPFNYDILDGSNSIMVNPESVEEIASAIKQLKDDAVIRERLAEGSKNRAKDLSIAGRAQKIKEIMFHRDNNQL